MHCESATPAPGVRQPLDGSLKAGATVSSASLPSAGALVSMPDLSGIDLASLRAQFGGGR